MFRILITAFFFILSTTSFTQNWQEAQESGSAQLNVYWYTSIPFVYSGEDGEVTGLEYDLLQHFKDYLKTEKKIDLELNWKKADSFLDVIQMSKEGIPNFVGISAFSITEERKNFASFSKPFLSDVTVLVSSQGTKIVRSLEEIYGMMDHMTAVTIKGTRYEELLFNLKEQFDLSFDIVYIYGDEKVLNEVAKSDDRFGFIDLPVYLMLMKDGGDLVRQNFFTVTGQGYGFLFSKDSDWVLPINEFISYAIQKKIVSHLAIKYMGQEVYNFLDKLYGVDEIGTSILTKEKELQLELTKQANLQLEKEKSLKGFLIAGISIIGLFLTVIAYLFYKNQKTTQAVISQKDQIYQQQEDIKLKNEQLINRNTQLMAINEEKNHLIKILAHDIRSPLSQITMIADLLSDPTAEIEENKDEFLKQVSHNTERINNMVTKILDVDGIEDHSMKVLRERVDIREILQEIKVRYANAAHKKKITLTVINCDDNFIIRTDHLLLTLVLENLVSNAIKFSPTKREVLLESCCQYDEVLFKVSDQGPGFTEKDKELVFNKFQKLSARPTGGESSIGLGLSIVKKYVAEIGGEVWLESEEGKGSTFFVKLII